MLALQPLLTRHRLTQQDLAAHLGLSRAALAQWLNHDAWPVRRDSAELRAAVTGWLQAQGIDPGASAGWWDRIPAEQAAALLRPGKGRGKRAGVRDTSATLAEAASPEDTIMLLRGQRLSEDARRAFGLFRDPFRAALETGDDVYLTPDVRYVREAMRATAEHGGMTAVVGESGSGKTTLRDDLRDWIGRANKDIRLIEPYVIEMEERSARRRTMGARDIASAIVHTLAPHDPVRQDSQARFRQVHGLLGESHRQGSKHCLIIEEAHDLPVATLRHLKRYLELREGHVPLLSVLLLGQPELGFRLSELDASIREIVQRCEVVTLRPLSGAHLAGYLSHRLAKQGKALADIFSDDALPAIDARLTSAPSRRGGPGTLASVSLLYPLAVGNLVTACINRAADLGLERVSADLVREV